MPLSKERNKARMRLLRATQTLSKPVQPESLILRATQTREERLESDRKALANYAKPKTDALQSKSSPLKDIGNSKLPFNLDASGEIIPEYW